jgi:cytochrome c oxidase subunit II
MQKFWAFLFGAVLLISAGSIAVSPLLGWWLPVNACSFGYDTDRLFNWILGVTAFFFFLTEGILVYAMFKYVASPARRALFFHGSHKLELIWTAVPAVILLIIAFAQVETWASIKYQARMPIPDQVIEVSARQFEWRLRYPTIEQMKDLIGERGMAPSDWAQLADSWNKAPQMDDVRIVNEIHTWKDARVRVYLKTRDVIHSFFLPNMRIKQDALPGKTIPVWFHPDDFNTKWDEDKQEWAMIKDKEWELACAELCGWGHYKMRGKLYVHETKADYEKWLSQAQKEQNRQKP